MASSAVAHELQHLAALALDRVDQDLGMIVQQAQDLGVAGEQLQHAGAGDPVGEAGEAGEVAVPDHGVDHLDLAALDVAAEHTPGGVGTEIGREQGARGRRAQRRGDHHGQQRLDAADPLDVGLGEAARSVGTQEEKTLVPSPSVTARTPGGCAAPDSRRRPRP